MYEPFGIQGPRMKMALRSGQRLGARMQAPVPPAKIEGLGLNPIENFRGVEDGTFWDSGRKAIREDDAG